MDTVPQATYTRISHSNVVLPDYIKLIRTCTSFLLFRIIQPKYQNIWDQMTRQVCGYVFRSISYRICLASTCITYFRRKVSGFTAVASYHFLFIHGVSVSSLKKVKIIKVSPSSLIAPTSLHPNRTEKVAEGYRKTAK